MRERGRESEGEREREKQVDEVVGWDGKEDEARSGRMNME